MKSKYDVEPHEVFVLLWMILGSYSCVMFEDWLAHGSTQEDTTLCEMQLSEYQVNSMFSEGPPGG